jgi:hypothetical protein
MRRVVALGSLIVVLGVVLTWELTTSEDGAASVDAVVPAGLVQDSKDEAGKAVAHAFDADSLADIAASITQRPLFSPTRRPSSNGQDKSPELAAGPAEVPRLTGVIVGPAGGSAIFAGADGKSHAAAIGDAIGAFKVRAIGPGVVTLMGSEGDRVVRPTYLNPPGAAAAEIAAPEATSPITTAGNRKRDGRR